MVLKVWRYVQSLRYNSGIALNRRADSNPISDQSADADADAR